MTDKKMSDKEKIEFWVIITVFVLGLIGGTLFYILKEKPLSAVFWSLLLGSFIYKFLGGIAKENTFRIGAFKLCGSAAFIIGAIFFLNYIFNPPPKNEIIKERPTRSWFPFLESGLPGRVVIKDKDGKEIVFELGNEDKATVQEHRYILERGENYYWIKRKNNPDFLIGKVDVPDLGNDLFNNIESPEYKDIFTLKPFDEQKNEYRNENLPFYLKVHQGYLDIIKLDGKPLLRNEEIVRRSLYAYKIDSMFYIVCIVDVRHVDENSETPLQPEDWYSRYFVGKFRLSKR
jgi:hypothetical protein